MILDDIYQFLKAAGRASTHAEFSIDYLGHSARYYDYLRCSGATPSLRSLLKLALRLGDISREAAPSLDQTAAAKLARQITEHVSARCR